jgi:hypothetical protein
MLGRYDRADEEKPMYRLDRGTLTIDGYQVLKIFGTDSGKRWFVTLCEEVQEVTSSESSPGEEIRVPHQQYFVVIRDSDEESWEFWMDEEFEPDIRSGEVRNTSRTNSIFLMSPRLIRSTRKGPTPLRLSRVLLLRQLPESPTTNP